jgi:hypothetical protein
MSIRFAPAIFCGALLLYLNIVLTNLVSLRQLRYIESLPNGTKFEPLHDTLFIDWVKGYNIDQYVSLALRDMVDVCTYSWVLLTILAWWTCSRKALLPAKVLVIQMIIIPVFSISQLLTVVPDSMPNCITVYEIPTDKDTSWIFWKWPNRACGNMLWSSDLAQLIIFTSLAVQMISSSSSARWFVWVVGECWTFLTMIFIFSSRYQYSMDVFITILVVKLLVSHPWVEIIATHWFIKKGNYYARAPTTEMPSL